MKRTWPSIVAVLVMSLLPTASVSAAATPNVLNTSYDAVNQVYSVDATVVIGAVGDTFTLTTTTTNNSNSYWSIVDGTGAVTMGGASCTDNNDCRVDDDMNNGPATGIYTIASLGTVTLWRCLDTTLAANPCIQNLATNVATITLQAATPPVVTYFVSFDPNGGDCLVGSGSYVVEVDRPWVQMPTCSREGFDFVGWDNGSTTISGGEWGWSWPTQWSAVWEETAPPEPPASANILVNFICESCTTARLWWSESPTTGVEYEVVVTSRPAGSEGEFTVRSTTRYSSARSIEEAMELSGLFPGFVYRVDVVAVRGSTRSVPTPNFPGSQFTVRDVEKTIVIVGGRTAVNGKPGVVVDGYTTGFAPGDLVVPNVKFPGQTTYSSGFARPLIDSDGEFQWQRRTGKKIYVYFRSSDGLVKSNRIIVQAQ